MPTVTEILDSDEGREQFFDAISDGGIRKACRKLGLNRASVYRYAEFNPDFKEAFDKVKAISAEILWDECIEIADDPKLDPRDKHVRIETRMRVAGKLIPRLADRPQQAQVNVGVAVAVTCDEERRAKLIELRNQIGAGDTPALPAPAEGATEESQ